MAIVLRNPTGEALASLGTLLGQALGYFGASYFLNRDLLNQLTQNRIDNETYNALVKALGKEVVDKFVYPVEQGYVIDTDRLGELLQTVENPILQKVYDVASTRKKFAKRNILSRLVEVQDPNVVMAMALTPSTITKWQEEVKTKEQLRNLLKDQLGVNEDWLDLFVRQPLVAYPILLLNLLKQFNNKKE